MSKVRRSVGFTITVLLSLALPIAVIAWSVDSFFVSDVEPFDFAILKQLEKSGIRSITSHKRILPRSDSGYRCRAQCVNPSTGKERSIELDLEDEYVAPLWIGHDLYFCLGISPIYKLVEEPKFKSKSSPLKLVAQLPNTGFCKHGSSRLSVRRRIDDSRGRCAGRLPVDAFARRPVR